MSHRGRIPDNDAKVISYRCDEHKAHHSRATAPHDDGLKRKRPIALTGGDWPSSQGDESEIM